MSSIQWPPLGIGFALAAAIVTAVWKAARLRGDANREWSSRISVVEAGLTQRSIGALSILRRKIDSLIGGSDTAFDPSSATADPALLLKSVRDFERCMLARRQARRHFGALLSLGSFAGPALVVLLACDILGALHLSQVWLMPVRVVPWVIRAAYLGGGIGVCVLVAQWYLQRKLTDAEMLSERRDLLDDEAPRGN